MRHFATSGSHLAMLLLIALPFAGCGDGSSEPAKPKTVVDPNAPPPPTPEELARRATTELGLDQPLPARGTRLPTGVRGSVLASFREKHGELSKTPEGQMALKIIQRTLEDRIDAFQQGEYWEHVVTYTDAYAVFQPTSKKYNQLKEKAMRELRKPRVTVHGLPEVGGHKIAVLRIYIPLTSETFSERLSIGEEAHGVKFLSVIGRDRGVRLEFLESGERYTAYLPSQK